MKTISILKIVGSIILAVYLIFNLEHFKLWIDTQVRKYPYIYGPLVFSLWGSKAYELIKRMKRK